jgi:hypothetical protein
LGTRKTLSLPCWFLDATTAELELGVVEIESGTDGTIGLAMGFVVSIVTTTETELELGTDETLGLPPRVVVTTKELKFPAVTESGTDKTLGLVALWFVVATTELESPVTESGTD